MSIVIHKKKFGARAQCQPINFVLQIFFFWLKIGLKLAKKKYLKYEIYGLAPRARAKLFFVNYYAH